MVISTKPLEVFLFRAKCLSCIEETGSSNISLRSSVLSASITFRGGESCGARSLLTEATLASFPSHNGPLLGLVMFAKIGTTGDTIGSLLGAMVLMFPYPKIGI
ncbi:hypothetical protein ACFX13_006928 [Malus domestica]